MRRALAAAVALLLATGCGIGAEEEPRALPGTASASSSSPAPAPTGSQAVPVFLADADGLVEVERSLPPAPGPEVLLLAVLEGPTVAERARGLRSVVPPEATTSAAAPADGVVTVQLPEVDPIDDAGTNDELLGYAQIVLTLDASDEVSGVLFERGGEPVDVPRADGSLSPGRPARAADYAALL